jgi:hypothetical protein
MDIKTDHFVFPEQMTMVARQQMPLLFLIFILLDSIAIADAFLPLNFLSIQKCNTKPFPISHRPSPDDGHDDDHDDDDQGGQQQETVMPLLLPAMGSSSLGGESRPLEESNQGVFVGNSKFELQYTCNICETRNCHRVSRIAYRQGVVIARCKGCDSQHLIADNLGWTNYKGGFEGGVTDIEAFFAKQGKADVVTRVSPEVFDLEKILGVDTSSGSIIGENGELTME